MTEVRRESVLTADGIALSARRWKGDGEGYVLVHGLASNLETWGEVADEVHGRGHGVVAYDQRGHGRSSQAVSGHDLATALDDLDAVIAWSGFRRPVLAGQSWGANLVLAHAALRRTAAAAVLVDGGTVDLAGQFDSWDQCAERLRPPPMSVGLDQVEGWMRSAHPDWSDRGIAGSLANLTGGDDGRARNRLPTTAHMQLLRTIWDNPPGELFGRVDVPTLLLLAETPDTAWTDAKRPAAEAAGSRLPHGTLVWVQGDHDLHVQQPGLVARHLLDSSWR